MIARLRRQMIGCAMVTRGRKPAQNICVLCTSMVGQNIIPMELNGWILRYSMAIHKHVCVYLCVLTLKSIDCCVYRLFWLCLMTHLYRAIETTWSTPWGYGLQRPLASLTWKIVSTAQQLRFDKNNSDLHVLISFSVNIGGYIQAVLDRNLAENISRVLYPNDNVSNDITDSLWIIDNRQ